MRSTTSIGVIVLAPLFASFMGVGISTTSCTHLTTTSGTSDSGQGGEGNAGGSNGSTGVGGGSAGNGGSAGSGGGTTFDPNAGWTEFKESADTIKVYVSSTDGNDTNDGSAPEKAVKTLAKGKSILRDGKPDWMLLKRGDVWTEALGTWSKSGRSAAEPMVVMTYGDAVERPLLKTGAEVALSALSGTLAHLAFVGLHFYAHTRDPDSTEFQSDMGSEGIRWLTPTDDLLFEDMMVQYYAGTNFTIQGAITNFKLRRSIVVDSYSGAGNSEGIYLQDVNGILVEENLLDHNGWNDSPKLAGKGTGPTIFNHNMYVQVSCDDVTIRGNISTRAASHGFQARAGGIVENNLVIDNPIGFSFGRVEGGADPRPGGITGHVSGNVVRDAGDISASLPRGVAVQIGNIASAVVEDNIITHDKSAEAFGSAIELSRKTSPTVPGESIKNLEIKNNIIFDWRGGFQFSTSALENVTITNNDVQASVRAARLVFFYNMGFSAGTAFSGNHWFSIDTPTNWFLINLENQAYDKWLMTSGEMGSSNTMITYPDPQRTLGKYQGSIMQTPTFDAYLAEARKQSRKNYRYEYTAYGPLGYIREGFGKK